MSSAGLYKTVVTTMKRPAVKTLLLAVLFALAFLWLFQFAAIDSSNNIDGSWHFTLTGLSHNGTQTLGRELYFSYGPLFERGFTYVNPASTLKDFVISDVLIFADLGLLIFTLITFLKLWGEKLKTFPVIIVALSILLTLYQIDTLFYVTLFFSALALLREKRLWARLLILAGIDLFALYKFSFSFALVLTCLFLFFEGFNKLALKRMALNWGCFIVLFWLLYSLLILNLNPIYLARYFYYGTINAAAYSEFMGLPLSLNYIVVVVFIVFIGIVALGILAYLYEQHAMFQKPWSLKKYQQLVPLVVLLISSFFLFKEAVVRTDAHVILFVPILFIWCGLFVQYLRHTKLKVLHRYSWLGIFAFGLVVWLYFWLAYTVVGYGIWSQLSQNVKAYATSVVDNRLNYHYFEKTRARSQQSFQKRVHELDKLLSQPGVPPKGATIIDWGNTTLLSRLLAQRGYHVLQEPFLQNYEAHPPTLFDPVYIHFLKTHPHAYIFEEETEGSVNEYIPTYQLNNYFEYVVHNYRVTARNDDLRQYFLRPVSQTSEVCQRYAYAMSHTGSSITLPQQTFNNNQYLKAKITFSGTLPEMIFGLFVKQPTYDIHIYNQDNGMMRWRVNKTILQHGIVVDPLYLNYHDYVNGVPFQLKHMVINDTLNRHGDINIQYQLCTFKK